MRNLSIPLYGISEKSALIAAGFLGGVVSAMVGTGENSVVFMVMVLLFRVSEKIVTPTTVVLMTMVTIPGFLLHLFLLHDFTPTVMGYWLAAVPVVAVGAPLGALICSHMKRHSIVLLLLFLIALEFLSTLFPGADVSTGALGLAGNPDCLWISGLGDEPVHKISPRILPVEATSPGRATLSRLRSSASTF